MADWNAQQVMDHFFRRPELKALYTGILADFVVRPSQFPGLGVPTVNLETAFDQRIPLQVSRAGPRPGYPLYPRRLRATRGSHGGRGPRRRRAHSRPTRESGRFLWKKGEPPASCSTTAIASRLTW